MRQFHHIGMPTDERQPGEYYVEDTKVWVTDPRKHPNRVEYLRFEPDSPVSGPVRDLPHVAYRVDDIQAELRGEQVLIEPFSPSPGFTVAQPPGEDLERREIGVADFRKEYGHTDGHDGHRELNCADAVVRFLPSHEFIRW